MIYQIHHRSPDPQKDLRDFSSHLSVNYTGPEKRRLSQQSCLLNDPLENMANDKMFGRPCLDKELDCIQGEFNRRYTTNLKADRVS